MRRRKHGGFTQHQSNAHSVSGVRTSSAFSGSSFGAGFTLIELLVVIAIIGLLSAVVLASLTTTRLKALDTGRMQDIKALKLAIEMYASDNGGNNGNLYPIYLNCGAGYNVSNLAPLLVPRFISHIPQQLIDDGDQYVWGPGPGLSCAGATAARQYGILAVLTTMTTCKTGTDINTGWWGTGTPECAF